MPGLERIDPLPLLLCGKFVSFVGAGGKTSLGEYLGRKVVESGKRAVITTTTRIQARQPYVLLDDNNPGKDAWTEPFMRVGKSIDEGKLTALGDDEVERLGRRYDFVLIEADGAKRRPLKYPAAYEPVIPHFSDLTVVVAGLDALGGAVGENVFRWEFFTEATGLSPASAITVPVFLRFFDGDGLMKGVDGARSIVVLNKYDACRDQELVPELAGRVHERTACRQVIVASVQQGAFYGLSGVRK